jgi:hypothetical protein
MNQEYQRFIALNLKAFKDGEINGQKARENLLKIIPSIPNGEKRYIKKEIFKYNNLLKQPWKL